MINLQLKMARITLLGYFLLVLPVTHGLSRKDCTRFDKTLEEERIFQILCTSEALLSGHLVFSNPKDNHKFYVCTDRSTACTGTCPNGGIFDKASSSCKSAGVKCALPAGSDASILLLPLNGMFENPCARIGSKVCSLFNHHLKNRFIICVRSTTTQVPMVGQCLAGFEFSSISQSCVKVKEEVITCNKGQNPCKPIPVTQKVINADSLYFGCFDDPAKFIQCDRSGKMTVKQCKKKTIWSQKDHTCVSQ